MHSDLLRVGVGALLAWRFRYSIVDRVLLAYAQAKGYFTSRFEPDLCFRKKCKGRCNCDPSTKMTLLPCAELTMYDEHGDLMCNDEIRIGLLECVLCTDDVGQEVNLWWLLRKQWDRDCSERWWRPRVVFPERIEANINSALLKITHARIPIELNGDNYSVIIGAHVLNVISCIAQK